MAIIKNGELIEYSTKLYKQPWSSSKLESIITTLLLVLKDYTIHSCILSIIPAYYRTDAYQMLWQEIVYRLRTEGYVVIMYRQENLQLLCGAAERMSRKLLMEVLVERYPILRIWCKREMRSKNKYYFKMFEAIAIASLYLDEINNEKLIETRIE